KREERTLRHRYHGLLVSRGAGGRYCLSVRRHQKPSRKRRGGQDLHPDSYRRIRGSESRGTAIGLGATGETIRSVTSEHVGICGTDPRCENGGLGVEHGNNAACLWWRCGINDLESWFAQRICWS